MSEKDMELYVRNINSYKPDLIRGYTNGLYELCNFIEKKGMSVHQPKVVVSSVDKLRRLTREKIESVFGTKIYDYYGTREVHGIAGECKESLLHIFMFNNYVEVLDEQNRPVREGEEGKVVVTNLHNYSMPLIRYELGDMAILGPKRCKCGNPLPTLKEITGRIMDYFVKEDGSLIHAGYFLHPFRLIDQIKAYQIIQEDYTNIRILAVLKDDIREAEKRDMEWRIKLVMGKNCKVVWDIVDEIPKTQSGKYFYVKSLLYHE
jgi:phenylacetate-CoA ligase